MRRQLPPPVPATRPRSGIVEKALKRHCRDLGLPWVPFQLDMLVRNKEGGRARYLDVSHGAVIIEYEPPASFRGREGARLQHARARSKSTPSCCKARRDAISPSTFW